MLFISIVAIVMTKNKKKIFTGIVYSTDSNFDYVEENVAEQSDTLPPEKQALRVSLDKKQRAGKAVTLVTGFIGSEDDLIQLGKNLKQKCGVGGSVKDRIILLQGDFRKRVIELLIAEGYKAKQSGG